MIESKLAEKEYCDGLTESELLERCSDKNLIRASWQIYWTAEIYSFGKYLREYGYFPDWLPICVYTDHGPFQADYPIKHELESDAPVQLYHSLRVVEEWKKISKKSCYSLYSPFVYYRRTRGITQNPNAIGTLAYPSHTTPLIDDEADYEEYIDQLMSLPKEFHPISVQLHIHDINKGQHKLFMKYKIPVYTAGHYADYRFAERFYETLRKFRFTTANVVMSCLFYSVEMGIPHFIYGIQPEFNNKGQEGISAGKEFKPLEQWQQMKKITNLFSTIKTEITKEQREVVEQELGLESGLKRIELSRVLYTSLLSYATRKIKNKVKKYVGKPA